MLGAIIGDIVGSRFEFNNHRSKEFDLFAPECNYTDDTICTIAVADALLRSSEDYAAFLTHWCSKYPTPMGSYGARFNAWVHSKVKEPYHSYGNGSAMRVSPVALVLNDKPLQDVLTQAEKSASCTHNHPEGIKGARVVAALIWHALQGADLSQLRQLATERYPEIATMTVSSIRATNRFDETCQVTVPQAIVCALESTTFEDAIRNAISIGGDSDTIACIAGGIAEALHGIPQNLQSIAISYLPPDMKKVLDAEYGR